MKQIRNIMGIAMATVMIVSLCAVYASTGVNAGTSSKASVQQTPSLVGSPIASGTGPTACAMRGSPNIFVFVQGYDGALWFRMWDERYAAWNGSWTSLGGQLTSSPAATSTTAGHMDVYVRGTNGALYARWTGNSGASWTPWYTFIGGTLAPGTGPAACVEDANTKDLFVTGTNNQLYWSHWTSSTGFSAFKSLGGQLTSSPAAVSYAPGHVDVYVRGTDGAVYGNGYWDGAWYGWMSHGGKVAAGTGPAACSWNASDVDLFVEGTNGALYQRAWTETSGWSSWTGLGGGLSASPTAATFKYYGMKDIEVFVRGTGSGNGLIYVKEYVASAWWGWLGPYQGPP